MQVDYLLLLVALFYYFSDDLTIYPSIKMELKIMLSHILLHYDITLPPGTKQRAANFIFNGAIVPDSKAQLVFIPRPRDKF